MGLGRLENQFSKGLKLIDAIAETQLRLKEGESVSKMLRLEAIKVGFGTCLKMEVFAEESWRVIGSEWIYNTEIGPHKWAEMIKWNLGPYINWPNGYNISIE